MIQAEGWYAEGKSFRKKIREMGLGYVTRYIQSVGGYCYYYKGGTSSGPSGRIHGDTTRLQTVFYIDVIKLSGMDVNESLHN